MNQKIRIAVIGCGDFARNFVPLFQLHPFVESVCVCDLERTKAEEYQKLFHTPIADSFEAVLDDENINTVAIFTQRHTHGPLVVKALLAGKDVYSAVPMGTSVEECGAIIEAVKKSGRTYMMGETCVYYPCSMYCRELRESGEIGKFVYGESQYFHDLSHFPKDFIEDRRSSAVPPFFYPTHSTAMILNAAGAHAVKVTAFGYRDQEENTPFAKGENHWDNEFSNEFSLMQLSNGGVARVAECRRIAYKAPSSCIFGFYGTEGSYQFNNAQHLKYRLTKGGVELEDVSDYVNPAQMTDEKDASDWKNKVANHAYQINCFAPIQAQEQSRLPETYLENPQINSHMASHQMLIDDFCKAVYERKLPRVNAWVAARFTIPGLIAHQSALQGGIPLDIPDFGDPEE